jgi:hypothetical protein
MGHKECLILMIAHGRTHTPVGSDQWPIPSRFDGRYVVRSESNEGRSEEITIASRDISSCEINMQPERK